MGEFINTTPPAGNPLTDEFDRFVKKSLDEWKIPGLSIAVVDGEEVFTKGYGLATLPSTPATPQTIWYGASTTKAFLAAAVAHLIDTKAYPVLLSRGWATPISSILRDDFVLRDGWAAEHLTLEDAVSHRTGFPRHDKSMQRYVDDEDGPIEGGDGKRKRYATVKDVVRNLRNLDMTAEPRVKFQYCNLMFVVLTHVVETLTGRALADVLREMVFEPLGMTSTYMDLDVARAAPGHFARGYSWIGADQRFEAMEWMPVVEIGGAGAIMSTAVDYAKWLKCLLHKTPPFSPATHDDIRTPRFLEALPEYGRDVSLYGLGWERQMYADHAVYTHSGGMHAYGAEVFWVPDAKFGLVAFANTAITSNAVGEVLAYRLINEKLSIAPERQLDPAVRWHELIDKVEKEHDKGVELLFPDLSKNPLPSPLPINELAGKYYDEGYKTLDLRVESHPDKPGEQVLVSKGYNSTWQYELEFHHVTGTWWIAYMHQGMYNTRGFYNEWEKAEFKIGPDGKPSGLVIEWWARLSNMFEGEVEFKRVEETS